MNCGAKNAYCKYEQSQFRIHGVDYKNAMTEVCAVEQSRIKDVVSKYLKQALNKGIIYH